MGVYLGPPIVKKAIIATIAGIVILAVGLAILAVAKVWPLLVFIGSVLLFLLVLLVVIVIIILGMLHFLGVVGAVVTNFDKTADVKKGKNYTLESIREMREKHGATDRRNLTKEEDKPNEDQNSSI